MSLLGLARASLLNTELQRLQRRLSKREDQLTRSQFSGNISGYNADQGVILISPPEGGTLRAVSITTGAGQKVAVSVPRGVGVGSSDSKPIS